MMGKGGGGKGNDGEGDDGVGGENDEEGRRRG